MEKSRELYNVMNFAYTAGGDIMIRVYDAVNNELQYDKLVGMMNEFKNLQKYVNECLLDIAKNYKSVPIKLNEYLEERY
jgi:hypothetical protein